MVANHGELQCMDNRRAARSSDRSCFQDRAAVNKRPVTPFGCVVLPRNSENHPVGCHDSPVGPQTICDQGLNFELD